MLCTTTQTAKKQEKQKKKFYWCRNWRKYAYLNMLNEKSIRNENDNINIKAKIPTKTTTKWEKRNNNQKHYSDIHFLLDFWCVCVRAASIYHQLIFVIIKCVWATSLHFSYQIAHIFIMWTPYKICTYASST